MSVYNYELDDIKFNILKNHHIIHCDNNFQKELGSNIKENDIINIINKEDNKQIITYIIVFKDDKGVSLKRKEESNVNIFLKFLNKIWGQRLDDFN